MKAVLLLATFLGTWTALSAQTFEWTKTFGGTLWDVGQSVNVDSLGNVYTSGYYMSTMDFDPGVGVTELSPKGIYDVFVQKMDASGNFLWARSFGGLSLDLGLSSCLDSWGNIYTTGYFKTTADFDPGIGTYNLTANNTGFDSNKDLFIQKMDASGNFLWARSFGGTSNDEGSSICTDAAGNVYVTGYFIGTVDFDPSVEVFNLTSVGHSDVFVLKLDASGNFIWARSFGGTIADGGHSISVDVFGNVYTTGDFNSTVDFDPGSGTYNLNSGFATDVFVQKMDSMGGFIWARSFEGTSTGTGFSISIDPFGSLYTTGTFWGTVDFDPGPGTTNRTADEQDVFIQKMDPSGNFTWVMSIGGMERDFGYSVCTDSLGNLYATGIFEGTVDFDPGAGTAILTSSSESVFILKLDTNGNFLWVTSFKGNHGYSTTDPFGNIYTTGGFSSVADFDPGPGSANHTSAGGRDIFVQKLGSRTLGVSNRPSDIQMAVYPNPTKGLVNISFMKPMNNVLVSLRDMQGKMIYTEHRKRVFNTEIQIDGEAGIYFLSIRTPKMQSMVKLVKEE